MQSFTTGTLFQQIKRIFYSCTSINVSLIQVRIITYNRSTSLLINSFMILSLDHLTSSEQRGSVLQTLERYWTSHWHIPFPLSALALHNSLFNIRCIVRVRTLSQCLCARRMTRAYRRRRCARSTISRSRRATDRASRSRSPRFTSRTAPSSCPSELRECEHSCTGVYTARMAAAARLVERCVLAFRPSPSPSEFSDSSARELARYSWFQTTLLYFSFGQQLSNNRVVTKLNETV